ncbi:glycoprotein-N-acetylgalactosamine 3-beta-galactosyltransferase 1 [Drosophila guanche]|uniref:N-acetylgalactosaminide beta-1,3-galactosyltransferase n=1 Tax=Drosophila guanche TaxID=7266 RepID=A0A3B0JJI9_DROGU|nr:glycoprotein-N-acetylgalactosamine 3-beta-galactosyltransferase 1 [Drosophila guanche]SPP82405.1 blast:Glycoprotein-N-acetylgalactosamine 3-beta-galactosyltransferase 1 [Drosophila guanche]
MAAEESTSTTKSTSKLSGPLLFLLLGIGIGYLITQVFLWPIFNLSSRTNLTLNITSKRDVDLYEEVRVLCFVYTKSSQHHLEAMGVFRTWGKRCNKLVFMSDKEDTEMGAINLPGNGKRIETWRKTKQALKYIYDYHLDEADWFLEADTRTYVIMENLRQMLYPYSSSMPIYFGSPGIVMSRAALRRFVDLSLPNATLCEPKDTGATMGKLRECLNNAKVMAGNSRDIKGRRRMYLIDPQARLNAYLRYDPNYWFWQYIAYRNQEGTFSWSNYPVTFHYVQNRNMFYFEYMIYRLKGFGHKLINESLPAKIVEAKEAEITAGR